MNGHIHENNNQTNASEGRRNTGKAVPRIFQRKALTEKRRAQTLGRLGIQPALKVGAANDKYEQEADKVAEHVVNSPGPAGGAAVSMAGNGMAQRGMDRTAGRTREIDRDEEANVMTKRLQREVEDSTDEVNDDKKDVANASPLAQRMIGRDAADPKVQRMTEPDEKLDKKPIEISRMTAQKTDDTEDALKAHDDSAGFQAGAPAASELGQRMEADEEGDKDEKPETLMEKPLAQRDAVKGYDDDAKMKPLAQRDAIKGYDDDAKMKPLAQRDAVKGYDDDAKMKPLAQRECKTCEQDARRKAGMNTNRGPKGGAFTASNKVSREVKTMKSSGGAPLPAAERAYLEPRFGRDLSHVRIHNGDRAAKTSQAIQAKAFTVGNHIAFNKGYYSPGTHEGRKLLAHEITHTIQQTGGSKKKTGEK